MLTSKGNACCRDITAVLRRCVYNPSRTINILEYKYLGFFFQLLKWFGIKIHFSILFPQNLIFWSNFGSWYHVYLLTLCFAPLENMFCEARYPSCVVLADPIWLELHPSESGSQSLCIGSNSVNEWLY